MALPVPRGASLVATCNKAFSKSGWNQRAVGRPIRSLDGLFAVLFEQDAVAGRLVAWLPDLYRAAPIGNEQTVIAGQPRQCGDWPVQRRLRQQNIVEHGPDQQAILVAVRKVAEADRQLVAPLRPAQTAHTALLGREPSHFLARSKVP